MYKPRGVNYIDSMNFIDINKKLFEQYPVKFPIDNKLSIVTGMNGTGKTKMIDALRDYFVEQGESVLYFPTDRIFNFTADEVDALEVIWEITGEENIMNKYNFKVQHWDVADKKGKYIDSGMLQIINLFGTIHYAKKPSIVLIDSFERSLHILIKRTIIGDIMRQKNVSKLVLIAYSPETWCEYTDCVFDINCCVNIRG